MQQVHRHIFVSVLLFLACISGEGYAQQPNPAAMQKPLDIQELNGPYAVEFKGIDQKQIANEIKGVSETWTYRKKPPPTKALLRLRMAQDTSRFIDLLKSYGYFMAKITPTIEERKGKIVAIFTVQLNEPFVYSPVDIQLAKDPTVDGAEQEKPLLPQAEVLGITKGTQADYKTIIQAEKKLLSDVKDQGFPFAVIVKQRIIADYQTRTVRCVFEVKSGPRARFGPLTVKGLKHVKLNYVEERVPWKEGSVFNPKQVQEFRQTLNRSGLFSVVMQDDQAEVSSNGAVAVDLILTESKRHSIGFGAGYNTENGAGFTANWENRNLFGEGELLHFDLDVSEKMTLGELRFGVPEFYSERLSLTLLTRLAQDDPRAYVSLYWKSMGLLNWKPTDRLTLSGGVALKASKVEQFDESWRYLYSSVPATILYDYRNDRLDPTHGGMVKLGGELFSEVKEKALFYKGTMRVAQIVSLLKKPLVTFSADALLGTIQGAGLWSVPADERFYAGGSETVRGYPYQMVGPLLDGDPTGGRSIFTVSGEVCIRVYGPVGLLLFIDGGSVFDDTVPQFNADLLWGAGGGLRLYSPVGVVGLEVGIPLDRRESDDSFQFYITIGFQF